MNDKIIEIFTAESEELIQAMEEGLLALENDPTDAEQIHSVFRAAHTIKGNAGFVGLEELIDYAHLQENILDKLRQGQLEVSPKVISLLLESVDVLKGMIEASLSGTQADETRIQEMESQLQTLAGQKEAIEERPATAADEETAPEEPRLVKINLALNEDIVLTGTDPLMLMTELKDIGELVEVKADVSGLPRLEAMNPHKLYTAWDLVLKTAAPLSQVENAFIFVADDSQIRVAEMEKAEAAPPAPGPGPAPPPPPAGPAEASPPSGKPPPKPKAVKAAPSQRATTIRVDTDKLDKLVNLVGEMVIGVARVNQITGNLGGSHRDMESAVEGLGQISRELQEQVMRVRMVPVEPTFTRFQRVVRDLATEMKKDIRLVMSGTETELDKNVIEQINDPLKHLIRNSVDHGLEGPDERIAAGKPAQGTIWLRAYQQESNIIIEVADDGHGIDREAVYNKAVKQGLLAPGTEGLSDSEIFAFMFKPGFSTAKKVTEVSGRGVGLDVVRRNIENLKGGVEVESAQGQGSTFRVKLPITLAIIDGMAVSIGPEIFTIPLMSIIESMRPQKKELKTVEGKGELVLFRETYIPLVRLHKVFGLPTERTDPTEALVIILESRNRKFGVLVDQIEDEIQAVIKSLEKNYYHIEGTAGATIMGDGNISIIVDITGLEKLAFGERN